MDLPTPPKDSGLRNIIDKLAEFVARNGPEFESITKAKQMGNPKFGFLYGGDYYQYYQWRVSSEQTILKQQGSISQAQNSQQSPIVGNMGAIGGGSGVGNVGNNMWMNGPNNGGGGGGGVGGPPINNGAAAAAMLSAQIEAINGQQSSLGEQIIQSEQNLSAQHNVILQQQQAQIDESILKAQHEALLQQADEQGVRLTEFEAILQPIVDSCTKDSISAGKNWILQHTTDSPKCNVILQYLLKKALVKGAPFTQKLHLIYLVNDVLHHCVRKRADDLKNNLENIVIPMFCSGQIQANEDQKAKLTKLLSLWESKANFFDACVISKLRSPESSMQEYKTNLLNTHQTVVSAINQATKSTFDNYKQQHQTFIQHAGQQITILEKQKQSLIEQQQQIHQSNKIIPKQIPPQLLPPGIDAAAVVVAAAAAPPPQMNSQFPGPNNMNNGAANNNAIGRNERANVGPSMMPNMNQPPPLAQNQPFCGGAGGGPPNNIDISNFQNPEPPTMFNNQTMLQPPPGQPPQGGGGGGSGAGFALPPPNFMIPDLSKPPPGFPTPMGGVLVDESFVDAMPPQMPEEVKPSAPFYELPAGLMVPLIRLEDYEYHPLDPDDLRLPPPLPPTERLLSAVDAFYAPPSHDRPRDGEGWEKLALYEYYKVKNAARKSKEEEIEKGVRERSRSPSPIVIESLKLNKANKRRYKSRSRSRSKSRSKSPPPHQQQQQPPSPTEVMPTIKGFSRKQMNRFARSPKKQNSPATSRRSPSSPSNKRDHHRDRQIKERESSASPPPTFFGGGNFVKQPNDCIEESNKGHQMLMKMGWAGSGTGLGSHGQGIDTPISGGEVRDRQDQFKGVGINLNDPYENFRKNKGAAFIHRMRSRDTDRKGSTKNASPEP